MRQFTYLQRRIEITREGIVYEADPKHVEALLQEYGMQSARPVVSPGVPSEDQATRHEMEKLEENALNEREAKRYRGAVARFNYISQDRMDLGFASKELSRNMAKPTEADVVRLKRALRYILHRPRAV